MSSLFLLLCGITAEDCGSERPEKHAGCKLQPDGVGHPGVFVVPRPCWDVEGLSLALVCSVMLIENGHDCCVVSFIQICLLVFAFYAAPAAFIVQHFCFAPACSETCFMHKSDFDIY